MEGVLTLLRRVQAREQRTSGREAAIILGYEASYDGFWLPTVQLECAVLQCCLDLRG